jgi:hypothetical protein
LDLAFFGLISEKAAEIRKLILTEVHEIVFHGNGGYIWSEVYNMPIYLRRFTLAKLREYYDNQVKASQPKDPNKQTLVDPSGKVNVKQFKSVNSKYK